MSDTRFLSWSRASALILSFASACVESPCPEGTYETAGRCEWLDAGTDSTVDAAPDSMVDPCTAPSLEVCNGIDDDCNQMTDDGPAANSCGNLPHAIAAGCSAGSCFIQTCAEGWLDCDHNPSNGCEAALGSRDTCGSCGDACGFDCVAGQCVNATQVSIADDMSPTPSTCILTNTGRVACYGDNGAGQAGINMFTTEPLSASRYTNLTNVRELVSGGLRTQPFTAAVYRGGGTCATTAPTQPLRRQRCKVGGKRRA